MLQQLDELNAQLDRLAAFEPGPYPVVSLYLNLQADGRGRDAFGPFVRKEFTARINTYSASPERDSLTRDAAHVEAYLDGLDRSANGLALFACDGAGLFNAFQLAAPIEAHRLSVASQPHLYPLARLVDEFRRYLVLLADTNRARIFVFAANKAERQTEIEGQKTKRHKVGGMSQTRYQRHVENYHLHHAAEIAEVMARTVRDEKIDHVIVAGDPAMTALLQEQLPKDVRERIVDVLRLNVNASERTIVDATVAAMRERDARTDRERVNELLGAYRANGLACVGLAATREALERGQVDELLIAASPDAIAKVERADDTDGRGLSTVERVADAIIAGARNISASVRFIEDASIAATFDGVGAFLRFKISPTS
jgi:peptide subunit release factor 1 (eRF1)